MADLDENESYDSPSEDGYEAVNCERRKYRQNVSHFQSLIKTPAVGAVTLPAGARLSFSATAGALAGSTLVTIVGPTNRTIKSKGLAAGVKQDFDWAERGVVITPSAGVNIYIDQGLGRWAKIAGG